MVSDKLITHLISITSLLLSSYFSFHSDTSLSLATILNKTKEKQKKSDPLKKKLNQRAIYEFISNSN